MSDKQKIMTREELEQEIIKKAWEDDNFKKDLMDKPHEAIARFGVHVPKQVEVKVVEESAKVVYLVLPVNQEELSDTQLDNVAGGFDFGVFPSETCSRKSPL